MKRFLITTILGLFLSGMALAQDQKAQLVQAMRSDGYPLESEVLSRLVDLDLSPEWWAVILEPNDKAWVRGGLRIMVTNLYSLANNMGLGDAGRLDQDTGRKANSPPLLAMLDSWKGKIHAKVVLKVPVDKTTQKEVSSGLDRIGYPIGTVARPRSGTFDITLTFDATTTKEAGTVSPDGGTYNVTVPAYMSWSQSRIDDVMKRGR